MANGAIGAVAGPTLDDLLTKLPQDYRPEHLAALGILAPAPPPPAPVTVAPMRPPEVGSPIRTMTPPVLPGAPTPKIEPLVSAPITGTLTPPTLTAAEPSALLTAPRGSLESFASRRAEPANLDLSAPIGAGPQVLTPGSSAALTQELARQQDIKAHPLGSPENMPGTRGRILHTLGAIGNIAGDILIPHVMANVPGTQLNRDLQIAALQRAIPAAATAESERALRGAQTAEAQARTQALQAANKEELVTDAQGNVTGWKDKSQALHSLDEPNTPQAIKDIAGATESKKKPTYEKMDNGSIVAISTDKQGNTTSNVVYQGDPKLETDLVHGHMVNGVPHTVLVNKKTGEQIKDLGSEKMPPEPGTLTPLYDQVGNMVGTFNNKTGETKVTKQAPAGSPLEGAVTPQEARVQAQVRNQFNTQFEVPATAAEQSYRRFREAYQEYLNHPETGAASMVALSQHLGTTLGGVKGARIGEEMIQQHKDAIGLFDRIQRYADTLATGQQLSAAQWKEFNDLITNTRQIQWETTTREAVRRKQPVDFLPPDVHINMEDSSGKVRQVPGNRVQEYLDKGAKLAGL
jgi:hypothetical protein